jgi:predicted DCC family thiol-disulfide oxidoreductase YuxK
MSERRPPAPNVEPAPGARAVVLYDADCGFCTWLLAGLLRFDRPQRLRPVALQRAEAGDLLGDLTPAERMASWHLVCGAGARFSAGAALAPLLALLPRGRVPAAVVARLPGITERAYRRTADHRTQLSRWVPAGAKRRARELVLQRERALAGATTPMSGTD